ncbi:MAG: hypothetical protein CMF59_13100 [Leptospiraceae bacterium]|nr:hypothetical protein [Leptospiraceae bacterium]
MLPGIVIPLAVDILLWILAIASSLFLLFAFFRYILAPVMHTLQDRNAPPPKEGYIQDIIIDQKERRKSVIVGQLDGTIATRLVGIKEDHLRLDFLKERDLEEYQITVESGGPVFFRPPHARHLEMMRGKEVFESRELIGHPASFRIAAMVRDGRPIQYVEFELSTRFVMNRMGEEKMKFLLELKRIFPGLDSKTRNKKGVFSFSRIKVEEEKASAS